MNATWKGFALEQILNLLKDFDAYFWATHQGAELDLLAVRGEKREGFEFKYTRSPGLSPSMKIALKDLKLERLWVIHAGTESYSLSRGIQAVPLNQFIQAPR